MQKKEINKKIVIAAGGTGGHIFPAQSLAEILIQEGYEVILVCDKRADQFLQGAFKDIERYYITSDKHTTSKLRKIISYSKLCFSIMKVLKFFGSKKPNLIIGFGGYPTFPTLAAAKILRIKTAVHEQNAVLGVVNRFFASVVDRIFISFQPTLKLNHPNKSVLAASMVRKQIKKTEKKKDSHLRVVVIGGSQGAQVMTDFVPDAICSLDKSLQKKLIVHQQARDVLIEETKSKYKEFKGKIIISDFFDNVGELMNEADLIICRAGASTIAEVEFLGKAAIFLPYPHAVDNHQYYNALNLVDKGAGILIIQEELTKNLLASKIEKLLIDESYRESIEQNASNLYDKDVSKKFISEINKLVE